MKPKHVAIILDGNRRYAKKHFINPAKGHQKGGKNVERLLEWASELGIRELTLYIFSIENFNRTKKEFNYLMGLFREQFKRLYNDPRIDRERVKVNFIGKTELFPKDVQQMATKLQKRTKRHENYRINFAFGYGGRTEIADAARRIAEKVKKGKIKIKDIDEETMRENLYLSSYPDIIIRTGGEKRISNFLIYQGAYSEWFFLDKLWPEFTKNDLRKCIVEFEKRERRFGK
ncbi:di-trans,poly-cis-decaprenylcistransferase [Candidatus Woesearchaeota archaeon]|nr:di-trans,poly-cis-decaprenylcistransferase [Candidatus Woesearchaeota archaeon]